MTQKQKDKELLLKDLCARLNYGVKVQTDEVVVKTLNGIALPDYIGIDESFYSLKYMGCKPYLFPLSSMTEEQKEEFCILCDWHDNKNDAKSILVLYQEQFVMNADVIDWFHENHFDYRGLIPMDLALDATNLNIY